MEYRTARDRKDEGVDIPNQRGSTGCSLFVIAQDLSFNSNGEELQIIDAISVGEWALVAL
jgi:hypothetical protein